MKVAMKAERHNLAIGRLAARDFGHSARIEDDQSALGMLTSHIQLNEHDDAVILVCSPIWGRPGHKDGLARIPSIRAVPKCVYSPCRVPRPELGPQNPSAYRAK